MESESEADTVIQNDDYMDMLIRPVHTNILTSASPSRKSTNSYMYPLRSPKQSVGTELLMENLQIQLNERSQQLMRLGKVLEQRNEECDHLKETNRALRKQIEDKLPISSSASTAKELLLKQAQIDKLEDDIKDLELRIERLDEEKEQHQDITDWLNRQLNVESNEETSFTVHDLEQWKASLVTSDHSVNDESAHLLSGNRLSERAAAELAIDEEMQVESESRCCFAWFRPR